MILSIGLNELPHLSIAERVNRWADNVCKYIGWGARWENFEGWVQHTDPREYTEGQDARLWANIAGRMFFSDLTEVVSNVDLGSENMESYLFVARQLLWTIWSRLIYLGRGYNLDELRENSKDKIFGMTYELVHAKTTLMNRREEFRGMLQFDRGWIPPDKGRHKLGCNSYALNSCKTENRHDNYWSDEVGMYTARNEAHWFQTVEQWKGFCLHWGARDLGTVIYNAYRWGHSEGAHLEIPENIFEEEKLIKKGKIPPLKPTYQKGFEPEPTQHYARIVKVSTLWPRTNPRDGLLTPAHPQAWDDDNPHDEDMRPGLFPQDLLKTPYKGETDERSPEKDAIRGLSDGETKAGGSSKKDEKEEVPTPNPENFWSQ